MYETSFPVVYQDNHIKVHHLRWQQPNEPRYDYSDFTPHNCLRGDDVNVLYRRSVYIGPGFFAIFPKDTSVHYLIAEPLIESHGSYATDMDINPVDFWELKNKFAGLENFFGTQVFLDTTKNFNFLCCHVEQSQIDDCFVQIKENIKQLLLQVTKPNLEITPLIAKNLPTHEHWKYILKLSMSAELDIQRRMGSLIELLDQHITATVIDNRVECYRKLKFVVVPAWLEKTMSKKLLLVLENIDSECAKIISECLLLYFCQLIDNIIAQASSGTVLEYRRKYYTNQET